MARREGRETFPTEEAARQRAAEIKASAITGYSETYVTLLFCRDGVWTIVWEEYYG